MTHVKVATDNLTLNISFSEGMIIADIFGNLPQKGITEYSIFTSALLENDNFIPTRDLFDRPLNPIATYRVSNTYEHHDTLTSTPLKQSIPAKDMTFSPIEPLNEMLNLSYLDREEEYFRQSEQQQASPSASTTAKPIEHHLPSVSASASVDKPLSKPDESAPSSASASASACDTKPLTQPDQPASAPLSQPDESAPASASASDTKPPSLADTPKMFICQAPSCGMAHKKPWNHLYQGKRHQGLSAEDKKRYLELTRLSGSVAPPTVKLELPSNTETNVVEYTINSTGRQKYGDSRSLPTLPLNHPELVEFYNYLTSKSGQAKKQHVAKQCCVDLGKFMKFVSTPDSAPAIRDVLNSTKILAYSEELEKLGLGPSGRHSKLQTLKTTINYIIFK